MIKLKRKKNRLFCLPVLSLMITDEIFYDYQLPYLKSNFHTKVWLGPLQLQDLGVSPRLSYIILIRS